MSVLISSTATSMRPNQPLSMRLPASVQDGASFAAGQRGVAITSPPPSSLSAQHLPAPKLSSSASHLLPLPTAPHFTRPLIPEGSLYMNHEALMKELEGVDPETRQNVLLKQLLAVNPSGQLTVLQDDPDAFINLTPEQQRQLDLIESMPLCKPVGTAPDVFAPSLRLDTDEMAGVNLTELKRQDYESKRQEFETIRKVSKKSGLVKVKEKKKKKKKHKNKEKMKDGSTKKKKNKKKKDADWYYDRMMRKLQNMGAVTLREPQVIPPNSVCVLHAAFCNNLNLGGVFSRAYIEGVADFYGGVSVPVVPHPIPGAKPPVVIPLTPSVETTARRKLEEDKAKNAPANAKAEIKKTLGQTISVLGQAGELGTRVELPTIPSGPLIESRQFRYTDTPDTVISSSSPEFVYGEEKPDFPALQLGDYAGVVNFDMRAPSPVVPVIKPIPLKAADLKQKREPKFEFDTTNVSPILSRPQFSAFGLDTKLRELEETIEKEKLMAGKISATSPADQQVSVTLTLSATATMDIGGVIAALADLLKIAVPPTYEVERTASPELFKSIVKHKEEAVNIQAIMKALPKFCRQCDKVVVTQGVRKHKLEIANLTDKEREQEGETFLFCGLACYDKFTFDRKTDPLTVPVDIKHLPDFGKMSEGREVKDVKHSSGITIATLLERRASTDLIKAELLSPKQSPEKTTVRECQKSDLEQHKRMSPFHHGLSVSITSPSHSLPLRSPLRSPLKSPLKSPLISPSRSRDEGAMMTRNKRHLTAETIKSLPKKWRGTKWMNWMPTLIPVVTKPPKLTNKEVNKLISSMKITLRAGSDVEDSRQCAFCHNYGDASSSSAGRLLNMDVGQWAHLNCALWSYEVYETLNGALINVDVAYKRSLSVACAQCHNAGATIGCFKARCNNAYHLQCLVEAGAMLFQDKTILCPNHVPKIDPENKLESLVVYRRVYIQRDEDKQIASILTQDEKFVLRIGSLTLYSIGQLLPHQLQTGNYNTRDYIYPIGFKTMRYYWSMKRLYKRCKYMCSIRDHDGHPEFIIHIIEKGFDDLTIIKKTITDVWMEVWRPLQKLRRESGLVNMFPEFQVAEEMFGLGEPAIQRVLESLPGTDLLKNYSFKFGRSSHILMPLTINPSGCARSEPKLRTHFRRPHTLQTSSTSHSLPSTVTGFSGDVNFPYNKQFIHSKTQQYRRLKSEWVVNVNLGRSRIQGLGLYAARDLEKHTMVIEYIGELIRDEVANRREAIYEEQNRGVYMFRIDPETVVDATMAGGPARYINHSCNPNCLAEVVHFERESKIIIITKYRIPRGQELTYDYKFDFEDDQHKIPCNCGAVGCRKWMN